MDTAVHNVVYRGNEHCGQISLVFSLSPCHTKSVLLSYARISAFTASEAKTTSMFGSHGKNRLSFSRIENHPNLIFFLKAVKLQQ